MSERKGDDAVRVPIEIKTEDLSELQQLIQELTEAEEASRTARASGALPARGSAGAQSFAGQARKSGRDSAAGEGPGGIFGGVREKDAMPMTFRDRTGKQALARESPFKEMQQQMKDLAEEQTEQTMGMLDQLVGMGMAYIPFVGGQAALTTGQKVLMNKLKQRAAQRNMAQLGMPQGGGVSPAGIMPPVGAGMGGGAKMMAVMGKIRMMAARGGPIGAAIAVGMTAIMLSKEYIDWTHSPGGPNDLRFRRVVSDEMNPLIEREKKQEINIGTRVVRVTLSLIHI